MTIKTLKISIHWFYVKDVMHSRTMTMSLMHSAYGVSRQSLISGRDRNGTMYRLPCNIVDVL
jgi:hypothetical protein